MEGIRCDDGRMMITWNIGNDPDSVELDEVVRVANMFNQYIDYRGLPGTVGFPEGMGQNLKRRFYVQVIWDSDYI